MSDPTKVQVQAPNLVRRDDLSSSSSPTPNTSSSFIGNTPSTVLFFIALAVGVCIALLFIYFTLRYFVKTKFGVYIPSSFGGRIGPSMAGRSAQGRYAFTGGMATFNNFNDFADYALHRDYNALLAVRERRLQNRRYRKKRKLTNEEVDELFPTKTYHDWVNGGKEDDLKRQKGLILHENDLENINQEVEAEEENLNRQLVSTESGRDLKNESTVQETDITDLLASSSSKKAVVEEIEEKESKNNDEGIDIVNVDDGLHFSSGMCAICLDTLEDEDIVRGLICGHVFHQDCIDPWLINRKACCPMCKRDYYMKDNNGADGEEGEDGESLMPLDSIADYILPRPIAYRARELLDVLDAGNNQEANGNNDNNSNNNSNENTENNETNANENNENFAAANHAALPNHHLLNVDLRDLAGIRELALQKLPSYYNVTNKLFWRVMGISKQNLTDYLIVKIYEDRRNQRLINENRELTLQMLGNRRLSTERPPPNSEEIEMQERVTNLGSSQDPENDLDVQSRRSQVENMV